MSKQVPDVGKALEEVMEGMAGKGKRKAKAGAKAKGARKAKAHKESRKCGCGCGKMTKGGEFLPGHDSRLKSQLLKKEKAGDEAAKAELRKRGW